MNEYTLRGTVHLTKQINGMIWYRSDSIRVQQNGVLIELENSRMFIPYQGIEYIFEVDDDAEDKVLEKTFRDFIPEGEE